MADKFHVRIQRQDGPQGHPYLETFEVAHQPDLNIISVLQTIAANPLTITGKKSTPVVWDCNCLEEVCGACSMVINGRVRQACTALVDPLIGKAAPGGHAPGAEHAAGHALPEKLLTSEGGLPLIELKPMTKFPIVRDLFVDRGRMFAGLKRMKAWIPVDTYGDLGEGPQIAPEDQERMYPLSCCMTCGCCLEACPNVNEHSDFVGPQSIAQAVLFNMNPVGAMTAADRLKALMDPGGLGDCGNAQNCVKVCPKHVPLTWAIGKAGRDTTVFSLKRWLLT